MYFSNYRIALNITVFYVPTHPPCVVLLISFYARCVSIQAVHILCDSVIIHLCHHSLFP